MKGAEGNVGASRGQHELKVFNMELLVAQEHVPQRGFVHHFVL